VDSFPKNFISDLKFKTEINKNLEDNLTRSYLHLFYQHLDGVAKKFNFNSNFLNKFLNNSLLKNNLPKEEQILLKEIETISSESTLAIGLLINRICKTLQHKTYLNIGTLYGFSLFAGMINTKCNVIGVDNFCSSDSDIIKNNFFQNFNKLKKQNHQFLELDYKIALEKITHEGKKINFYYYDAGHSFEDHRDNLIYVKDMLDDECLILIDDIGREEVIDGTYEGLKHYKNYKVLDKVITAHPRHPTFWNGYILIRKN